MNQCPRDSGSLQNHGFDYTHKMRIIERERLKRKDMIRLLESAGFTFYSHGGRHDTYKRGKDSEQIPRHREINEQLARFILRKWSISASKDEKKRRR